MALANGQIDDLFTSTSSDDYNNDSDFIQHIVMSGHTSYADIAVLGDSDNNGAMKAMRDSCTAILTAGTYSNFSADNQTIERSTIWPSDSANDHMYYNRYRQEVHNMNINGVFRIVPYVRSVLRVSGDTDSAGNNWGN